MTEIQRLLHQIIADVGAKSPDRIPLIGVAGAQGSGKSHQCRKFAAANPRVAHFSLDDVYLTKAERVWRAANISSFSAVRDHDGNFEVAHIPRPEIERLLLTRGPPGTHDLKLAEDVIARLRSGHSIKLPHFDKAADDRAPEATWPRFQGQCEAILVDGWCLAAKPTPEEGPLNDIEREDVEGIWRRETQTQLRKAYADFFAQFDAILYLRAPSWESVKRWRAEQEAETLGRPLNAGDNARLEHFMMHYERITKSMMAGGHCADWVVELDEGRGVMGIAAAPNLPTSRP